MAGDDESGRVDAVIAEFLERQAAGESPDERAWLERHSDLAEPLAEFFADRRRMERWAKPLRPVPPAARPGVGEREAAPTLLVGGPDRRPPGTVLRYFGDYELLEEVARGGMGVVYKARQTSLNRVVALKMILSGHLAAEDDVRRFRTEAEAAAHLDHPHIVPVHEVGEHEGQHYFSMKLVEGGSLAARRNQFAVSAAGDVADARARQERVARLVADVADAVAYAHQRGVIHRDLKPANVLIDAAGTPFVTDFGLAARAGGEGWTDCMPPPLTLSGAILGTPAYMAPEQAAGGGAVTTLADVYGLGAILYELLAGRPPFRGATPVETLRQVIEDAPPPPSRSVAAVDRDLEAVCLKCLSKNPADRYRGAGDLADDLRRWLVGDPLTARPASAGKLAWTWLRKNVRTAVWTVLIGLVAGAGWNMLEMPRLWNELFLDAGRLYADDFPSLEAPALATTWEPPSWLSVPVAVMGVVLFLTVIGLGNQLLVRPKDVWSDAAAGLAAGMVAGFFMFNLGYGSDLIWSRHDLGVRTGGELWNFQDAFQRAASPPAPSVYPPEAAARFAPGAWGRRIFTDAYPDLAGDPAPEDALRRKIMVDLRLGVLVGLVVGSLQCLVVGAAAGLVQTMAAGWLFRLNTTSGVRLLLCPVYAFFVVAMQGSVVSFLWNRSAVWTVAGVLTTGLAVAGSLPNRSRRSRAICYGSAIGVLVITWVFAG